MLIVEHECCQDKGRVQIAYNDEKSIIKLIRVLSSCHQCSD